MGSKKCWIISKSNRLIVRHKHFVNILVFFSLNRPHIFLFCFCDPLQKHFFGHPQIFFNQKNKKNYYRKKNKKKTWTTQEFFLDPFNFFLLFFRPQKKMVRQKKNNNFKYDTSQIIHLPFLKFYSINYSGGLII